MKRKGKVARVEVVQNASTIVSDDLLFLKCLKRVYDIPDNIPALNAIKAGIISSPKLGLITNKAPITAKDREKSWVFLIFSFKI